MGHGCQSSCQYICRQAPNSIHNATSEFFRMIIEFVKRSKQSDRISTQSTEIIYWLNYELPSPNTNWWIDWLIVYRTPGLPETLSDEATTNFWPGQAWPRQVELLTIHIAWAVSQTNAMYKHATKNW
jgi:hypothetical protein